MPTFSYRGTPPYFHLFNTVTLLGQLLFYPGETLIHFLQEKLVNAATP